jgi:hypothetical protein
MNLHKPILAMMKILLPILLLSGGLQTSHAESSSFKITELLPGTVYPQNTNTYEFFVVGEGFVHPVTVNLSSHGPIKCVQESLPSVSDRTAATAPKAILLSDRSILVFGLPRNDIFSKASVSVTRGDQTSNVLTVKFSRAGRWSPAVMALIVSAIILGLPIVLLSRHAAQMIDDRKFGVFTALLLDKETDTYSLSKFQFYLWTIAIVFGYIYLTISRSMVQGSFEFAEIPENLPFLIATTVGTSIAAQGITVSKGPKGAGDVFPSFANLVTSGGMVVAERFQFFVWTVVGVAAFLFLIILRDPGELQNLPQIPEKFLYLMGLSSAGYLGGKLARKAGPIIDDIRASAGSLLIEIRGRNLSKDASFLIDDQAVTSDELGTRLEDVVQIVAKETDSGVPNAAKILKVRIEKPRPDWLLNKHSFTLINPDGQKATWTYELACWRVEITGYPADKANLDSLSAALSTIAPSVSISNQPKPLLVRGGMKQADADELKKRLEGFGATTVIGHD